MSFYKVIDCKFTCPDFYTLDEMVKCSEADFINFIWSPIIVELLKNSELELRWGDPNLANSNARFRVYLRVVATVNSKEHDVGVSEFARFFKSDKAKNDHTKLILESKEYLNIICKVNGKPKDSSSSVYGLQVAGLKGHMISTSIEEDKLYLLSNITHQMHFPTIQDKQ